MCVSSIRLPAPPAADVSNNLLSRRRIARNIVIILYGINRTRLSSADDNHLHNVISTDKMSTTLEQ